MGFRSVFSLVLFAVLEVGEVEGMRLFRFEFCFVGYVSLYSILEFRAKVVYISF